MDRITNVMNGLSIDSNGPSQRTPVAPTVAASEYFDDRFDVDEEISLKYSRTKAQQAQSMAKQSSTTDTSMSDLRSPLTPRSINKTNVSSSSFFMVGDSKSKEAPVRKNRGNDSLYSALFATGGLSVSTKYAYKGSPREARKITSLLLQVNDLNSNAAKAEEENVDPNGMSTLKYWSGHTNTNREDSDTVERDLTANTGAENSTLANKSNNEYTEEMQKVREEAHLEGYKEAQNCHEDKKTQLEESCEVSYFVNM